MVYNFAPDPGPSRDDTQAWDSDGTTIMVGANIEPVCSADGTTYGVTQLTPGQMRPQRESFATKDDH